MDKSRIAKLADEILEGREAAKASTSNSTTTQYWIGIAGAPGSGKSTLVHDLVKELQSRSVTCVGVPMDGYHYSRAELDTFADPIAAHRFRGAPFTFNGSKFVEDLRMAKMEGKFSFPGFDHAAKDPAPDVHVLTAECQVVLVEGNYLLLDAAPWSSLCEESSSSSSKIFDEMWYLKCNLDELKRRLAARHMEAWGWTMEQAMERIEDSDGKNMVTVETSAGNQRASKVLTSGEE